MSSSGRDATAPAPQQRSGSGVRARLTRFSSTRSTRGAARTEEQLSIPGMEEVLNPELGDGRPQDSERALWVDITVVVVLTVLTVVPYVTSVIMHPSPEYIAALVSSMLMVGSVTIRRDQPMLMMGLVGLGATIQLIIVPWPVLSLLTIPIASYSVARWTGGPQSRWVLWAGALGAILGPTRWHAAMTADYPANGGTPWMLWFLSMAVCAGLVITPYAIGRRLREAALIGSQQRMAKAQRYRSILAEREQDARVIEERTRNEIARELHDIVAHSLSVMIVQAEGGKALALKKPEKAPEVLDIIADTGRDALVEMRRIVGVLRQDPTEKAAYSPSPGLTDIPELVEHSGDRISLTVTGERPEVSEALGLTAYRVVQEAVTNVLKHAGPTAHAEVAVHYRPTTMCLTITDDGHGEAIQGDGRGHGLQGMRERVTSMGGQLETGPLADRGFRVRALLPLRSGR
ncbi:sensor histidine kinase [Acidipropionibacterium jensenii]|uniref:sensor histidine kinase n=1 Tax=Acidipropionibacterium jensenii TaxID=1749 RepID=UPI00110BB1AF|nr:sensor histidine kinase [Acidipropionibacterium jensenii]QCV87864.1 sensor histidine kinase [Acidipropionibacterium jensenii]